VTQPYDALLLVSFGGPEGPDDVMPFLENVTRGRNIPRERLLSVAEHYQHFGGISPINGQNRALLRAIEDALAARGTPMRMYWGNRNWAPYVTDALAEMARDGVKRALALATSAFGSDSGCSQYVGDIAKACAAVEGAPVIDKLRHFYDHPGFLEAQADRVRVAIASLPAEHRQSARLVFTAHSVPRSLALGAPYVTQLEQSAALVATMIGRAEHDLVWQSRSGPPQVPWLEPDVSDHLEALAKNGVRAVVVVPIGFLSDHMEVVWDLDHDARARGEAAGLVMARAGTVGTHPRFIETILELIDERVREAPRRALGVLGVSGDDCSRRCCPRPGIAPAP